MAAALVAGLLATSPLESQGPPLWGGLKAGRHLVGYRKTEVREQTVHIWFPARFGAGAPLLAGAYFEGHSALPRRLLETPTAAMVGATGAAGPFPLVLYVGSGTSAGPDNTVLAEYLASHGFVVATAAQAGGLNAALDAVGGLSFVHRDSIAIVAHGSGWIDAVEFAVSRPAVRAILGLDPPADAPDAIAPGRSLAVLRMRTAPSRHDSSGTASPSTGITITLPRSTAASFSDRPAHLDLLDQPGAAAPDHRRLIGSIAHAFLDGALRAWGPSLDDLAGRLSRAGLEVTRRPP